MGKKNKGKNNQGGPADSGPQPSTSGKAGGNKEKDSQRKQEQSQPQQQRLPAQQQQPTPQDQQQQTSGGQHQQPKPQDQQQQVWGGPQQQPKPQGQQQQAWGGPQQQPKPQGQQQQARGGPQQQPKPQGQQQQVWCGPQQQPKPQGQQQQAWGGPQQQLKPKGKQQQAWGGPQQQPKPQGQQQQAWGGPQQQLKPQGQQQQAWGGPQQPKPQGQQQQAWGGPQQQPKPQFQQQQARGGPQQQPKPQGQQQQVWGGPQQQLKPQGQQQQAWVGPQQQPKPQGQQQQAWGGPQQQPKPQFQQQQARGGPQQQPKPQGQQQQAWGGPQQQLKPQGQQQQAWVGPQQQPKPQGQQQQAWGGPQQQPKPQGQQQQARGGPQQQPKPQVQQQQPTTQSRQGNDNTTKTTITETSTGPSEIHERGSHGIKFVLETNYLTLDLKNMPDVAYHYDVKIEFFDSKIKKPVPKKFLRLAFLAYNQKVWPKYALAYDGMASAYSAEKLPEDVLNANEEAMVTVKLEEDRKLLFKVTLKPTNYPEVDLSSLRTYQTDRIFDKPMRALQCIEVVLRTPCHERGVRGGRSFFIKPESQLDLGDGYELWYGLYQAAMLCDTPLLNVDVSHKSFPSPINLINFYRNRRYNANEDLKNFLKGLTVIYKPPFPNAASKHYKFNDVVESSKNQVFVDKDGKKMTVANYYAGKNYKLSYPDLPCLHVGSTDKNIYIPLEFITVPEGQAILRKDNEMQVRNMISHAATSTIVRKQKIMELLRRFEYYAHPVVERFGITVGENFIKVEARFIPRPRIQYKGKEIISINRPGEWQQQCAKFFESGMQTVKHKWVILNYSNKFNKLKLENTFVELVIKAAANLGMCLANQCTTIFDLRDKGCMEETSIGDKLNSLKKEGISIVFVILPVGRIEQYSRIKQVAEITCGVVTQCIKSDTIYKETRRGPCEINEMTVKNILLKVNAKLNGINHTIADDSIIPLQKTSKIMFVGADVSHPSPLQKDIPSIVGVVASHDLYGAQYNMQYRLQEPGDETIKDMKDIFHQHLLVYKSKIKCWPNNIIYYRDGVSDGQFKSIENVELNAMRTACRMVGCNPKFTCIIVVKRHHTRFFPKQENSEGRFVNVQAGTVVDAKIIHPGEEQFFMVSHKAIQGTSKPTRYNVIVDEERIPINDLQTLTYNLCHMFPRCNRSVSYPAPAYLSHLVGLRGRAYIQGKRINLQNLKEENDKRQLSADMRLNPMHFV